MKKKNTTPKKLQLGKIKVSNLTKLKSKGNICLTSLDQTTCPHCFI